MTYISLTTKEEREVDKVFYEMDKLLSEVIDDGKHTGRIKRNNQTTRNNIQERSRTDGNYSLFT